MIPCLAVFCAPLALIFGSVSLVLAKQSQRSKGLAIVRTALGATAIVIFRGLMIFALLSTKPKHFVTAAPEYETMIGEGLSGSGFHFQISGRRYMACSPHQLDGKTIKAHVTRLSFLEEYWFKSETPFVGRGGSGSPVVSELTGKVMGVSLGGNLGDTMTEGYFEGL